MRRISSENAAWLAPHICETSGLVWAAVHGTLCLGLRHPDFIGPSREFVKSFVEELGCRLVEWGILTGDELALVQRTEQQDSPHGSG